MLRSKLPLAGLSLLLVGCSSFTIPLQLQLPQTTLSSPSAACSSTTALFAKKKGKKKSKGFAKSKPNQGNVAPPAPSNSNSNSNSNNEASSSSSSFGALESIQQQQQQPNKSLLGLDDDAPTEDRTEQILRQRFGLRSYEEQQGDFRAEEVRVERRQRQRDLLKLAAIDDGSFDIFTVLPKPLIDAVDLFLKGGLVVSVILFVAAGVGITFEAWSASTGNALPEDMDRFIVQTVEPNFTPGLFVLLGFSVSLGIFAAAQLGSASSKYQEKP